MVMPGRNFTTSNGYRYGFNGKENDDEVKGIKGSQQDYGMRIYDPRLGRFLSVDPITREYPELTPYQFSSNTPIQAIDLDGLEAVRPQLARTQLRRAEREVRYDRNAIPVNPDGSPMLNYSSEGLSAYLRSRLRNGGMSHNEILDTKIEINLAEMREAKAEKEKDVSFKTETFQGVPIRVPQTRLTNNSTVQTSANSTPVPNGARAVTTYANSNKGATQAGYVGGSKFQNDGRGGGQILPQYNAVGQGITYREYDVNPMPNKGSGQNRGTERVVIDNSGNSYYTNDHYKSFTKIEPEK